MEEDSLSYRLQDDLEASCWEMCEEFGCIPYCPSQLPRHGAKTGGWLPTQDSWDTGGTELPFGWEAATDKDGVTYYVNHMQKTSTYEDPRKFGLVEPEDLPEPREVVLERNAELGFGFVAGSEKPVIVRFVTGGGPSVDKLLPGDQILSINGEDVARAPRDHVIQLVRNCKDTVQLVVCQPPLDNDPSRKSALLSVSKKAKLKSNPSRVRFAESVDINGSLLCNPSTAGEITSKDSVIPLMPNVLKVFLENGQTKSFKYDSSTTVQDVLDSLQAKLGLISTAHFSLVVEHVKSPKKNKLTLLNPQDTLAKIASRPGAHNLRCLFRVTFVPKDAYDLLRKDSVAFEYLYVQCCNDVVQERFAPELKYETALRLAALHIHQHVVQTGLANNGKITVKMAEKECGLERFVPSSLTDTMKRKELRKLLSHFLKINTGLASQGQKFLTGLQAKLHYLNTISELPSYGAKCFSANLADSDVETVILISPKFGMSQINSLRNSVPLNLCDIEGLGNITITKDDEISRKVDIQLKDPDTENITLFLESRDAEELVLVLQGYYKLQTERTLQVINLPNSWADTQAPSYCGSRQTCNSSKSLEDNKKLPREPAVPTYHHQTETFKMPNGQMALGSDEGSDGGSSRDSTSTMEAQNLNTNIDRNRNITLENNANLNNSPSRGISYPQSVYNYDNNTTASTNTSNQNNNSTFTGGILKKVRHLPNHIDEEQVKKEEDIRRVAEMEQILQDAEQYLTDADCEGEMTDAESSVNEKSSGRSQFDQTDSFLMMLQEKETAGDGGEHHTPIPGDTICRQTTGCPSRQAEDLQEDKPLTTSRSQLKNSDSSFGLHSPDNLPMGFDPKNQDVQMLLKKFQENPNLPRNFPGGALVLDPDLIDLTMIPPPITPDEDGVYKLLAGQLSTVSTPPTPFADRQTLEAELRMLQKGESGRGGNMGDIGKCGSLTFDEGRCSGDYSYLRSSFGMESQSDTEESSLNSATIPDLAMANVGTKQFKLEDIDSFIANMAVPPPPSGVKQVYRQHSPIVELTSEDISAFIIPPPPTTIKSITSSPSKPKQSPAKKITFAKEVLDNQEVVRNVRIEQEMLSSKIAQDRLAFFHGSMGLTLNKDKFGYPTSNKLSGVEQTKNTDDLHSEMSNSMCQSNEEVPPLPPPRSTIPKQNGYPQVAGMIRTMAAPSGQDNGPTLVKSVSQDTIVSGHPSQQTPATQKMNGSLSSSSDDIANDIPNNKLKKDPSMMSMTSSSDSLSSVSSVTTVKSVSPSDLPRPTEATTQAPPLLPRQSPTKARPPLASPEDIPANLVTNSPFKSGQTFKKIPGSPKPDLPSRLKSQSAVTGSVPNSPKSSGRSHVPEGRLPPTSNGRLVKLNGSLKKTSLSPPGSPAANPIDPTLHHGSVKMTNGTAGAKVDLQHKAVTATERLTAGRKLPVPPPGKSTLGSPYRPNGSAENTAKQNYKNKNPSSSHQHNGFVGNSHMTNGYNGHSGDYSDDDDEEEGTSVDGPASLKPNNPQLVFSRAEKVVSGVVFNLNESKVCCTAGDKAARDEEKFLKAKELLTNEARQFVTASKLFVKSATESELQLLECLNHCVHMIGRIGTISRDVAVYSVNPSQTESLISKVSDVVETYLETLQAASRAIGRDMNDPSMNVLMKKATSLAGVLTSLMRSLRVFN